MLKPKAGMGWDAHDSPLKAPERDSKGWARLRRARSDAVNTIIARELKAQVATFDHHYERMGAHVVRE
jgi:hypothetical protein